MPAVKIVVTGPFGAGKTTLIKTISEVSVLSTERDISDHTREMKDETTVAMDFGRIDVEDGVALYLFGTPGQQRFDFMWEVLSEGMLGYVVLVDDEREDSFEEAKEMMEIFGRYADVPFVVGVNKATDEPAATIERAQEKLSLDERVPIIPVDARDRTSVKNVLLALLYSVLETVEDDPLVANA